MVFRTAVTSRPRGGISAELVAGICLLSIVSMTLASAMTIRIQERQRIALEQFRLQNVFVEYAREPAADLGQFRLVLPGGVVYGLYDGSTRALLKGRQLFEGRSDVEAATQGMTMSGDLLYPDITIAQPVDIGLNRHTLVLRYEFDIERARIRDVVMLFLPFAALQVLLITGFAYAFYRKRILQPFRHMTEAYRSVSGENWDVRLGRSGIRDWDELYGNFNGMMDRLTEFRNRLEQTIRELSASNEALRDAQDEIVFSEKMATVGRLAAGLAHEIGNPLTSITGYLSYMKDNAHTDEERAMLAMVVDETERISRIIRDLLNFARIRQSEDASVACDPVEIIDDTLRLLTPQHEFGRVRVTTDTSDCAAVLFNPQELKQILINLVINAVDATPKGGMIAIATAVKGREVELTVTDEGGGVPDDIASRIFEPFFTTKPTGKGTGLGLSVAHTLVTKHGGTIGFANHGNGARFTLRLRRAEGMA